MATWKEVAQHLEAESGNERYRFGVEETVCMWAEHSNRLDQMSEP